MIEPLRVNALHLLSGRDTTRGVPLPGSFDRTMSCCKLTHMDTSAWVELVAGVVVAFAVLGLWLYRRSDPLERERRRAVREQETLNLARRMWMSGGE